MLLEALTSNGQNKVLPEIETKERTIKKGQTLEPGRKYKVTHRVTDFHGNEKTVTATRVFKWMETRFESIPCFVFSSKVDRNVEAWFEDNKLYMRGKRLPQSELSIPIYDLLSFVSIKKARQSGN